MILPDWEQCRRPKLYTSMDKDVARRVIVTDEMIEKYIGPEIRRDVERAKVREEFV